jgi:hypothetical protein
MNCHMPKRVYGLLGVRRSHQIEGDPAAEIAGTPSACMLCHLDMPSRTGERFSLAEGARTGDAATRVLVAGVLGLPEVRDATRASWGFEAPLFEALQNDPYAAVRIVARRSLDARPDLPQIPRRDPLAPPTPDAVPRDMRPITLSE